MSVLCHFNLVVLFLSLFINTYLESISASTLVLLSEIATFSGYIAWMVYVRLQGAGFRYEGITWPCLLYYLHL